MKYNNLINNNEVLNKPIVYEVIRVIDGKPLFLKDHLSRMENSIKYFSKANFDNDLCKDRIIKLINDENIVNQNIRIEVGNFTKKTFSYKIFSFESSYLGHETYLEGVDVIIINKNRESPEIKIRNDEFKLFVKNKLDKSNAYEAILIDDNGKILEGSKSNLFFIKDNKILTSKSGSVLEGITLLNVLKVINQEKIEIIRRDIYKEELKSFDGAFLTGTSIDILPISKIEDIKFDIAKNVIIVDLMEKFNIFKQKDMEMI
jgi:branched-chain amino acid aminotransferase